MFNLAASLAVLLAIVALYWFVIRPRLKVAFTDLYAHIDSFWERWWLRLWSVRSYVIGVLGALAAALPDILVHVSSLDFSFLPQPWGANVGTAVGITLLIMRAFSTTPRDQPPA